jgi:hypothetical protein
MALDKDWTINEAQYEIASHGYIFTTSLNNDKHNNKNSMKKRDMALQLHYVRLALFWIFRATSSYLLPTAAVLSVASQTVEKWPQPS